jgi:2-haloacid dehalogenase
MQLTDFKVLTFDCYGTLIDWETGIVNALADLVKKSGKVLSRDDILQTFARHEADQEALTPTLLYSGILAQVYARIADEWGIAASAANSVSALKFGASVADWPSFIDSPAALQYLKKFYKLVILSNVDHQSFKGSNARLLVDFDYVYTAQDVGSYKPNPRNFDYMIEKLAAHGYQPSDILHTAESLFHDHVPANKAGLASAWIYRRHAQTGFGATHPPETMPKYNFQFTSMSAMAKAHQEALRQADPAKTR